MKSIRGCVSEESFVNILFLEGEGTIRNQEESLFFQKGRQLLCRLEVVVMKSQEIAKRWLLQKKILKNNRIE